MLIEVLIGTTILLLVFAGVVQQISALATTRVQIETRDRAVAYVNSLHQKMSGSGCGLDVDTVHDAVFTDALGNPIQGNADSFSGSDQVSLRGPWDRVQGCAFSSLERAHDAPDGSRVNSYVDENDNVHLTVNDNGSYSSANIDKDTARKFCDAYGDPDGNFTTNSCELGDQSFTHSVTINEENGVMQFSVTVNYWFEEVGGSGGGPTLGLNHKSSCSEIISAGVLPDTLARRVRVTFPSAKGGIETMTVTKRSSVPVDSFQFASGTRVGIAASTGNQVTMYPNPDATSPWKLTRIRDSGTACIWFPYINTHEAGDDQPSFAVDNGGASEATLANIPALQTGSL